MAIQIEEGKGVEVVGWLGQDFEKEEIPALGYDAYKSYMKVTDRDSDEVVFVSLTIHPDWDDKSDLSKAEMIASKFTKDNAWIKAKGTIKTWTKKDGSKGYGMSVGTIFEGPRKKADTQEQEVAEETAAPASPAVEQDAFSSAF